MGASSRGRSGSTTSIMTGTLEKSEKIENLRNDIASEAQEIVDVKLPARIIRMQRLIKTIEELKDIKPISVLSEETLPSVEEILEAKRIEGETENQKDMNSA